MGKSAKGRASAGSSEDQKFTREGPIEDVHIWLQALSYQLPQWNCIPVPSWAQEPLIIIHDNETMILDL